MMPAHEWVEIASDTFALVPAAGTGALARLAAAAEAPVRRTQMAADPDRPHVLLGMKQKLAQAHGDHTWAPHLFKDLKDHHAAHAKEAEKVTQEGAAEALAALEEKAGGRWTHPLPAPTPVVSEGSQKPGIGVGPQPAEIPQMAVLGDGPGGSKHVKDPVNGQEYALKQGAAAHNADAEHAAFQVYAVLGATVPQSWLLPDGHGGKALACEWMAGVPYREFVGEHPDKREAVDAEIADHFVVDVLLGNHAPLESAVVGEGDHPIRVTLAGCLSDSAFSETPGSKDIYPLELWRAREGGGRYGAAKLSFADVLKQIETVQACAAQIPPIIPKHQRRAVALRLDALAQVYAAAQTLLAEGFPTEEVSKMLRNLVFQASEGLIPRIPCERHHLDKLFPQALANSPKSRKVRAHTSFMAQFAQQ